MQAHQETFGQKVQKSEPGQEEKSGFGKENNAFTGQNNFSQPEEMEKNSRIRKITTGGILTGSRRKKGNTIKTGAEGTPGAGKTQK